MTDLQMLGNSFCELGRVSTYQRFNAAFDPKVHHFENSLLKIIAQLHYQLPTLMHLLCSPFHNSLRNIIQ